MSKYNPRYTGNADGTGAADALNRALTCADAINCLLVDSFCDVEQGEVLPTNRIVASALWAMDGFIREASELSELIYQEAKESGIASEKAVNS